jgi:carboxyl-terminal processing protease
VTILRRLFLLMLCAVGVSTAPAAQSVSPTSAANLALFDEVWKTINDSFYDPTFGGLDWAGVRDALRPKAAAATSTDGARAVVTEMLARLERSHFALLSGSATAGDDMVLTGEATVDIDVRLLGADVVITADRTERAGDTPRPTGRLMGRRIRSIDGRDLSPRPGATPLMTWRRVNAALHGPEGSQVVMVLDDGERVTATRRTPRGQFVQFSNLPPMRVHVESFATQTPDKRRVGVIGFNVWMAQLDQPIASAVDTFRDADGLIFDLRGNPGGLAAMIGGVAGHILTRADLLGTMRTRQVPQLKFVANPRTSTAAGRTVAPFAGPVAILVDEMSASASECFAGGLQDLGRARIFGRTTMGQALPASTRRLANGDVLEYVIGDFVTSKGRSLEGSGVVPDEVQPLSIASLSAGHDDPLRAALAWMDRQAREAR